jgi:hypothetical protein
MPPEVRLTSMRATFSTTALEAGAQLEDVQKAAGTVTRVPPRSMIGAGATRKAASFFATYCETSSRLLEGSELFCDVL